ncbi:MAG: M24 family metallopeptidase, partial [Terriglobia bacterium]
MQLPATPYLEARRQALRGELAARRIASLVVSKPANIFYLTGFRGSAGVAVFTASDALLMVDPRYTLQARDQAAGTEVVQVKDGLLQAAGRWVSKSGKKSIGFEEAYLTCGALQVLQHEGPSGARWQPTRGLIEDLRVVKDDLEREAVRKAGQLTADALAEVMGRIRPGISERDLAAELDYRMRKLGAEGTAFETIIASGTRGALPHARPTAKLLNAGELVIFDLGAILCGYAADMTRTFYLGTPGRRVRALYNAVLEAERAAVGNLRAGVRLNRVDAAARSVLARHRLEKFFTHSTGHGVGVEIHEKPRIGKGEKRQLAAGS